VLEPEQLNEIDKIILLGFLPNRINGKDFINHFITE